MCLAVPGRVIAFVETAVSRCATVDFQGSRREVDLSLVPAADVDDWVLVHAGTAITVIDAEEARITWSYLETVMDREGD